MARGDNRIKLGQEIYQYFLSKGMAPHQAAAIAGNMAWEGGGRTDLVNPGDNWRNSPRAPHSIGIAQWNDRSPALINFARQQGIDIPDGDLRDARYAQDVIRRIPLKTQLDFTWQEMQGSEGRALRNITSAQDLTTANAGAIGYHRPAGWTSGNPYAGHGFQGRLSLANQIMRAEPAAPAEPAKPPAWLGEGDTTEAPAAAPIQVAAAPPPGIVAGEPAASPGGPLDSLMSTLFPQQSPQQQQPAQMAVNAPQPVAGGVEIAPVPIKPLDLTKIRAMLANRRQLGTGAA
jgi:hypothetical protein